MSSGEVSVVEAREGSGDTWHNIKMFIRQPWFIGTMGAVAWIILLIVVLLLYRQRRQKKKSQKSTSPRGNILSLCSDVHELRGLVRKSSDQPVSLTDKHFLPCVLSLTLNCQASSFLWFYGRFTIYLKYLVCVSAYHLNHLWEILNKLHIRNPYEIFILKLFFSFLCLHSLCSRWQHTAECWVRLCYHTQIIYVLV